MFCGGVVEGLWQVNETADELGKLQHLLKKVLQSRSQQCKGLGTRPYKTMGRGKKCLGILDGWRSMMTSRSRPEERRGDESRRKWWEKVLPPCSQSCALMLGDVGGSRITKRSPE